MENAVEDKAVRIVKKIIKGVIIAMIFLIVVAAVVYGTQWLWNSLIPELFGGPVIGYWQTLGLLVLTRILLFPWSKGGGGRWHRGAGYWGARWKSMTPEQRDRLKARMQEKWCRPAESRPATDVGSPDSYRDQPGS